MRLVKSRFGSGPWFKRVKCSDCGSVYEVEEADLSASLVVGKEPAITFSCGICNNDSVVTRKIPHGMRDRLRKKSAKAANAASRKP